MSRLFSAAAMLALAAPGAALGQETTTFEYDAQGRLTESARVGGPASGVVKATVYDAAGNRTNQSVTGAQSAAGLGAPAAPGISSENAQAAEDANITGDAALADAPPVSEGAPLLDPPDAATSPNGELPEPGA